MQKANFLHRKWQLHILSFLLPGSLVVILDQISKSWIRALSPAGSLSSDSVLQWTHITNSGALFGIFPEQDSLLVFSSLAIVLAFLLYSFYSISYRWWSRTAWGLVLGGGVGNLIDRFRFGYVTDFIDIRVYKDLHWPVFNLADSAMVIGIAILLYTLISSSLWEES